MMPVLKEVCTKITLPNFKSNVENMKKLYTLLFLLGTLFAPSLRAQVSTEIDIWIINDDGAKATRYSNTSGTMVELDGLADVQSVCYNDDTVWISTQGVTTNMGYYTNGDISPGVFDLVYRLPRNPQEETGTKYEVPNTNTIGVLINGISIFALSDASSYSSGSGTNVQMGGDGIWNGEAWYSEGSTLDTAFGGHPAGADGIYHTHATPFRLYQDSTGHSPIVGYAFDGFPIYGPYGYSDSLNSASSIVRMESGYQLRNITERTTLPDGTVLSPPQYGPDVASFPLGTYIEDYEYDASIGTLDSYNGRWCVTPEYPAGTYAYFVTIEDNGDPAFPYYIGTEYYGIVDDENLTNAAGMVAGGTTCIEGYVELSADIENVTPNTATQGTSSVTVTFSFSSSAAMVPPASIVPDNVTLGGITGTSVTRNDVNGDVTATFAISPLAVGDYDIIATFNDPMSGARDYTGSKLFSITAVTTSTTTQVQTTPVAFPNPAEDQLHIVGVSPSTNVSLMDALGNSVFNGTANTQGEIDIDVFNFKTGMYFLKVVEGANTKVIRVVVK